MTKFEVESRDPVAGNTRQTRPSNNAYYPALDGLRALAFLLVFSNHYLALPWGFTGVDAFFVLSGFLITGILYDTRADPHRAYNFYIRRTLRIFPLYYGVILLIVLAYPHFRWEWNWKWLVWPAYLGNFARFYHAAIEGSTLQMLADAQPVSLRFADVRLYCGHFWSLCIEEQFYVFWPWLVFWIKDRQKLMYLCLASIVACTTLRVTAHSFLPAFMIDQEVTLRATPMRIDALLVGGFVALVLRGPRARLVLPGARICLAVLIAILVVYGFVADPKSLRYVGFAYPEWSYTWALTFTELFFGCIVVLLLNPVSVLSRVLSLKPLRWLGRVSYGAYVFHDILHTQFNRLGQQVHGYETTVTAVLAMAFTLILSWASYRWLESPFIRLKERWTIH